MRDWKYILFDLAQHGETIVLFPSHVPHAEVSDCFRQPVVSAGFVRCEENRVTCYGHSVSLKVESRGEVDARYARHLLKDQPP